MNIYSKQLKKWSVFFTFKMVLLTFVFIYFINTQKKDTKQLNTLGIALDAKVSIGDPRFIIGDAQSEYIEALRFLSLVSFDPSGRIKFILLEKIEYKNNDMIFYIKQGFKFCNNQPITAYDVAATYNSLTSKSLRSRSPRHYLMNDVLLFKALDANRVLVRLKHKDVSFVTNLVVGILPKHIAESTTDDLFLKNMGAESGPFLIQTYNENEIVLTPNPHYSLERKTNLAQIRFKIIPDSTTRFAALIKGDVSLIQNGLDPDKIHLIETKYQNQFQVLRTPRLALSYLGFNFRHPFMSNVHVRKAIAYAVDRQNILTFRLRTSEPPAVGFFPMGHPYASQNLTPLPYSLQKAKDELKKTHIPLPIVFSIKVSSSNKTSIEIAKIISHNLNTIGFQTRVESLENSIFLDQVKKGVATVWIGSWLGFKDPDILRYVFHSHMRPPTGGNRGAFVDLELDTLLEQGRTQTEFLDRKKIYDTVQNKLSLAVPYLFLWHGETVAVLSRRFSGYNVFADGQYYFLSHTIVH